MDSFEIVARKGLFNLDQGQAQRPWLAQTVNSLPMTDLEIG